MNLTADQQMPDRRISRLNRLRRLGSLAAALVSAGALAVSLLAAPAALADTPADDVATDEISTNEVAANDVTTEATTCVSTSTDCFQFHSVGGKQLHVADKYGFGRGRYVRDHSDGNRGGADWRLMQVEHGELDKDGKLVGTPGRFKLWSWFETQRCLDTRDHSVHVIMWPCNSSMGNTRQWWHFQLAPDSVMAAKGLKPAVNESGSNMLFMIRNAADKNRCLTVGSPAVVADCNPARDGDTQLFSVSDVGVAERIKQLAVDYQNAKCGVDHTCEVSMSLDTTSGPNPDPILAYGCASIAEGGKEGIVRNGTSSPVTYNFTRRVSESQRHNWNFGVSISINAGILTQAIQKYSTQLQAGYGGEWSRSTDEEKSISRQVSPNSYAWEVRGVPQVPSFSDVVFNKSEGLSWTVRGQGLFSVNGNDRVQPILVFNEAPANHSPAPNCHTLGAPSLGSGEGPQVLRDGRNLGQTPPAVGETLSATPGEWQGASGLEFEYQWLADGQLIIGATSSIYTVDDNDLGSPLSVRVTTKKVNRIDATATSKPTAKVVPARSGGEDPGDDPDAGKPDPGPGDGDPGDGDPGDEPIDEQPVTLALKAAVSSGPYTPEKPPFFTVQVLLAAGEATEVRGTVSARWNDQQLVATEATLKGGRTMATLQLPAGVLPVGEQSIELVFTPADEQNFEAATVSRLVSIVDNSAAGESPDSGGDTESGGDETPGEAAEEEAEE